MSTPPLTHTVPHAILVKLGDVLASYALMEQSLKLLVGALASTDESIGAVICAEAPTKNLRSMAVSLYSVHFGRDEGYRQLTDLIKRADKAEQERNQIAHSHWGSGTPLLDDPVPGPDDVIRIKITAKQGLEWKRVALSAHDLNVMARTMDDVARDLLEFWRLNEGRARRRFAQHVADTIPADEIVPSRR